MDDFEEQQALKRAINGDAEAFAALLGAYYDMIYRTAYKWAGNQADAQDIAQDVCVKLGGAIRNFRMDSKFSSWLYRIVLNTARDMHRKKRPHADIDAAVEIASGEESQDETLATRQLWAQVRQLPEKQRDAVLLVYGQELSHAEAAQVMECAEGTVSSYIHEAKKQLKEMVGT